MKETDVGPESVWEVGYPWMNEDISKAVEAGILTPASKLKMSKDDEEKYNQGIVFERSTEILTRGHTVLSTRVEKVLERSVYSNYILDPSKFSFEKTVAIYGIIWRKN